MAFRPLPGPAMKRMLVCMSYSDDSTTASGPIRFADSLTPLHSAQSIEQRVGALIGRATIRQLWILFLDADDVQLPVLVPLDGLPPAPTSLWTNAIAAMAGESAHDAGAASIVLVWERYGPPQLSASDAEWLSALRGGLTDMNLAVRQIVVSHRTGVRLVADDEYASAGAAESVRERDPSSGSPE
jgi:hypothetical protein